MCFNFLADYEMKLSTGDLANGQTVEDFVLLLLCIYVLLAFSSDIFMNFFALNVLFLNKAEFDFLFIDTSCFGFTISNKYCNSEIYFTNK